MSTYRQHPTESWTRNPGFEPPLSPEASRARHDRMMGVIRQRIEAIRMRLRQRGSDR